MRKQLISLVVTIILCILFIIILSLVLDNITKKDYDSLSNKEKEDVKKFITTTVEYDHKYQMQWLMDWCERNDIEY